MLGSHVIKHWSSTQPSVTLSSGEAEFYGVVRGAGMGLGYQSLLRDVGKHLPLRLWTDSSAAIGICSRQGLGKLRHLDTHTLWVQQAVRERRVDLRKVDGEANPADALTKYFSSKDKLAHLVDIFGCKYVDGRSEIAPQVRQGTSSKVTIGEAMGAEGEIDVAEGPFDNIIIPHITYGLEELDERYPTMSVPDDPYDDDGWAEAEDNNDGILQTGLRCAREIATEAEAFGRRRYMPDNDDTGKTDNITANVKLDSGPTPIQPTTHNHKPSGYVRGFRDQATTTQSSSTTTRSSRGNRPGGSCEPKLRLESSTPTGSHLQTAIGERPSLMSKRLHEGDRSGGRGANHGKRLQGLD
jgi:hypothetical protein